MVFCIVYLVTLVSNQLLRQLQRTSDHSLSENPQLVLSIAVCAIALVQGFGGFLMVTNVDLVGSPVNLGMDCFFCLKNIPSRTSEVMDVYV